MKHLLIVLLILFSGQVSFAATHYIRPSGGGGGGTTWTDAYNGIPATLTRGDTYAIAGGSYGGYVFDDAVSGTEVITVRKASAALDSAITGWSASYATDQAIFSSGTDPIINFTTSYYVFNGVTGSGDGSSDLYGFKVIYNSVCDEMNPMVGISADHNEFSYTHVQNSGDQNPTCDPAQWGIRITGPDDVWVHHNTIRDSTYGLKVGGSDGATPNTYEYNYFKGGWNSSAHHQDYIHMEGETTKKIFRYNVFDTVSDGAGTGVFVFMRTTVSNPTYYTNDIEIYGNLIISSARAFVISSSSVNATPTSGWKIYNNTFVDSNAQIRFNDSNVTVDHQFKNNLSYNSYNWIGESCSGCVIEDYNYFNSPTDLTTPIGTNSVSSTESTTELFIDYAGGDYKLVSGSEAVDAGVDLGTTYNEDFDGNTRSGSWDIGAYEYQATTPHTGAIHSGNSAIHLGSSTIQ